jgi:predicted enzyme related to lactoylglutathione lyase
VNRVVHFEIAVENPEQVAKFYTKVFGWKFEKWQGPFDYWLITTGDDTEPGINGGLNRKISTNQICTVNTIAVESIDSTLKKIVKNGGKVIREKTAIPGVGYLAYCEDSSGILFGIMESDISARFY